MDLDVIIPTYNRHASLERTLVSFLNMPVPAIHSLSVTVADNNSTDATRETVDRIAPAFQGRLRYLAATRGQGTSFARNAGILATSSELVGFIDDDEEVDTGWAETVFAAFADATVDYIGGPYAPVWEAEPPAWVNHPNTRTGLGWADYGPVARPYEDDGFDAHALGGNTVMRRSCLERVGFYSEELGGRVGNRLGGEDTDMHQRLKAAGCHGMYLPNLVVHHHIPASRLTKRYMRRWAFWTSVSVSRLMLQHPQAGPYWFRLPRWMYGQLLRCPFEMLTALRAGDPAGIFNHELTLWRFAGVFHGTHFFRWRQG